MQQDPRAAAEGVLRTVECQDRGHECSGCIASEGNDPVGDKIARPYLSARPGRFHGAPSWLGF